MKCKNSPVGVCSWSLQTDVQGVAAALKELDLQHVNLGIRQAVEDDSGKVFETIKAQSWTITSTMIRIIRNAFISHNLDSLQDTYIFRSCPLA